jgi:hypothetical protein
MAITPTSQIARAVTRKPNPYTGKPPKRPEAALTPRVKTAIAAMVQQGLGRKAAAQAAGLSEESLYQALRKPVVLAHYNAELQVLRTSARARNVHVLEEIRDQSGNDMARVAAIKVLEPAERQGGTTVNVGVSITPGYVIDLSTYPGGPQIDHQTQIDANPLIEHSDVGDDDVPTR